MSRTRQKLYSLIFFTLPTVFQRVGIKEFAYHVDCGNIVCKSCCGRKDAQTVHPLRACLLGRASSQRNLHNLPGKILVEYIRMVLLRSL